MGKLSTKKVRFHLIMYSLIFLAYIIIVYIARIFYSPNFPPPGMDTFTLGYPIFYYSFMTKDGLQWGHIGTLHYNMLIVLLIYFLILFLRNIILKRRKNKRLLE